MGYSIVKVNSFNMNEEECLYECINSIKEADLLAQLAMNNKKDNELIIIMPGWNRGIENCPNQYKKALRLAKKYKVS